MKKTVLIALALLLSMPESVNVHADSVSTDINLFFTHDIHDYYYTTKNVSDDGNIVYHGGGAKIATILKENMDASSIYVDAGDFSMGTLLQAAYSTKASELELLKLLDCSVTTFGNHEFDYGAKGVSAMLEKAAETGNHPSIVCSNINFDGELSEDRTLFKNACEAIGVEDYVIKEVDGVKVAFIGMMGEEAISDSPTSGQVWDNYIDSAKKTVEKIGDSADIIVALSHSGTDGNGETGEDFELAKKVPEIDVIISGHTHSTYDEAIKYNDTYIVSQGCYLENIGKLTLGYSDGNVTLKDYKLIRIDETIEDDKEISEYIDNLKLSIDDEYLKNYGYTFDQVLTSTDFSFTSLNSMYATHCEYPMGDLIADSYIYAARENGIDDIDVACVGLGTIRSTFSKGDITVADAFEACSLGVGSDGSAGHPIIGVYITGKELKLLVELDASLGPSVSSIKMSYSGLEYTFNEKRIILDRVTDLSLVRPDGTREKIENDKLYKVCTNMYAANMLGMLNGLTKGILSISIKDKDGNKVDDLYSLALNTKNGSELKEWVAMADYLSSMDKLDSKYQSTLGRKNKISEGGLSIFKNPGFTTLFVLIAPTVLLLIIVLIVILVVKKIKKKKSLKKTVS